MLHEYIDHEKKNWATIMNVCPDADEYTMTLDGTKLIFSANDAKFFEFNVKRESEVYRICASVGKSCSIQMINFKITTKKRYHSSFVPTFRICS